ncbi:MAG: hypothetical protein WAW14_01080 [Lactococcus raffinolactis]
MSRKADGTVVTNPLPTTGTAKTTVLLRSLKIKRVLSELQIS